MIFRGALGKMPHMNSIALWFEKVGKPYPWRSSRTPYSVWVSEVMLQQTRAEVVIPYFERWMKRYPTVDSLSQATFDEVISLWEGLGYYSRARNLLSGAKQVVEEFEGNLPDTFEALLKIKGIGRYTAGAILAFGFGKRAAFVDGNIARVMARMFSFEECVIKAGKKIEKIVDEWLPNEKAPLVMEGLIELGQTICKKKPICEICPLQDQCIAYQKGRQEELPVRLKKETLIPLMRQVAAIMCNGYTLLKKNEKGKIMADLWEFPYIECDEDATLAGLIRRFPLKLELEMILPRVVHHFTKYKATLMPYLFQTGQKGEVEGFVWVSLEEMKGLPFSAGHRKIKEMISDKGKGKGRGKFNEEILG